MARKRQQEPRTFSGRTPGSSRSKRHGTLFAPIAFLLVCLSLIMAMSIFFKVGEIHVEGNSVYTTEEIIEASGIDTGDNLFFINQVFMGSRLTERLPYLQTARISRVLPNKVIISVTESSSTACVYAGETLWMIDHNCKLMGPTTATEADASGFVLVKGLEPIDPVVGDTVSPGVEESPKVSYLSEILTEIDVRGLNGKVTDLDISSVANPMFMYEGRFLVKLGSKNETAHKFGVLLSAVEQLSDGDAGTIDLSMADQNQAHFMQS
ncbi:MAG: FtsQ-type POTRA domain-containing protein [Oscillospiraceae bacterium]|jgi:cell division protein FtsQ|nr:FtsQ-type POTRA domain-containing protein [Oscillospiraceae bacterium]